MTKENKKNNEILLTLLREKQEKQGIHYTTRKDTVYKIFNVINILALIVCTFINLIYFFATYTDMNTKLSNKTTIVNDIQSAQISEIKNSLIAVGIMSIVLIASALFAKMYLPAARLASGLISSGILLLTYYNRLSEAIDGGSYSTLIFHHILPISVFIISLIIVSVIAIRQKHFDRVGCDEISERIYKRYSISATNVDKAQWNDILLEYKTEADEKRKISDDRKKSRKHKAVKSEKSENSLDENN